MPQDACTLLGTEAPTLDEHPLFDQFLIVGLPPDFRVDSKFHSEKQAHEPQIIYKYPPDKPLVNRMIPYFCFPTGLSTTSNLRVNSGTQLNALLFSPLTQLEEPSNSFVFLLTGESAVYYGICIHKMETLDSPSSFYKESPVKPEAHSYRDEHKASPAKPLPLRALGQLYDVSTPRVYCFISRFPFIKMHFNVLFSLLQSERMLLFSGYHRDNVAKTGSDNASLAILEYYYKLRKYETQQSVISLHLPNEKSATRFHCPINDDAKSLTDWGLFSVFERLDIENILEIFSYLMQERSVLVVSPVMGLLSSVVLSMLSLLQPFIWQCSVVPILPQKLAESIDSPVPYFMGLCSLPSSRTSGEADNDFLLIDLERNMLVRPQRRAALIPECSWLYSTIKHYKDQFHSAHQIPMQHRKYKFVEDITSVFKDYHKWLIELVSNAVMAGMLNRDKSATTKFFLDIEQNMNTTLASFKPEHQEFFSNFLRTQMFSVYSNSLYNTIEAKSTTSKATLRKLKELIAMEEKSREVLKEYSRCGVQSQVSVDKALHDTDTTLDLLIKSKQELEEKVEVRLEVITDADEADTSDKEKSTNSTKTSPAESPSGSPEKYNPYLTHPPKGKKFLFGLSGLPTLSIGGHKRAKSFSATPQQVEEQILSQPISALTSAHAPTPPVLARRRRSSSGGQS